MEEMQFLTTPCEACPRTSLLPLQKQRLKYSCVATSQNLPKLVNKNAMLSEGSLGAMHQDGGIKTLVLACDTSSSNNKNFPLLQKRSVSTGWACNSHDELP